jgi:hypothetical protein
MTPSQGVAKCRESTTSKATVRYYIYALSTLVRAMTQRASGAAATWRRPGRGLEGGRSIEANPRRRSTSRQIKRTIGDEGGSRYFPEYIRYNFVLNDKYLRNRIHAEYEGQ